MPTYLCYSPLVHLACRARFALSHPGTRNAYQFSRAGLENLPQEAAFILNEIKYRDEKVNGERTVARSLPPRATLTRVCFTTPP